MSAEVAIQKFSFPFSCAVRHPQQDEVTQKECIKVKTLVLHDLQEKPILSKPSSMTVVGALVHNKNQAQVNPKPGGDVTAPQVMVCTEASDSAALSRRNVFENLTVESEDQRPAAKRQLSSESAARTITAVKKSAVRKEAEEPRHLKPKAYLGQRLAPRTVAPGKRRRRKDLFTNTDIFHRIDSHVVRAGAEVRAPACSSLIQHETHSANIFIIPWPKCIFTCLPTFSSH